MEFRRCCSDGEPEISTRITSSAVVVSALKRVADEATIGHSRRTALFAPEIGVEHGASNFAPPPAKTCAFDGPFDFGRRKIIIFASATGVDASSRVAVANIFNIGAIEGGDVSRTEFCSSTVQTFYLCPRVSQFSNFLRGPRSLISQPSKSPTFLKTRNLIPSELRRQPSSRGVEATGNMIYADRWE